MDGEKLEINIDSFAFGGAGVGKLPDGKVCFVRGAAPGEQVEVELTDEKKSYSYGRLLSVTRPSRSRIVPECPLAVNGRNSPKCCPGCSYLHVDYATELQWKQRQLENFLLRGNLVEKQRIRPPEGAPQRTSWRNKIRLTAGVTKGKAVLGYKGEDNETVIDVPDCPLARKSIREKLQEYRRTPVPKGITHVTFRWTLRDGVLVRPNTEPPRTRFLNEQLGHHGDFCVPEASFFQINVPMAAKLAEAAAERIEAGGAEYLLELFCGVGVLSLVAAQSMERLQVVGVELDKLAVQAARLNAKTRHLSSRCRYYAGDAENMLAQASKDLPPEKTMILVDPPRCGLTGKLCREITAFGPRAILYVSCAPDTLRRDLEILAASGYEVCDVKLFDLFPGTAHFETVTVLRRKVNP